MRAELARSNAKLMQILLHGPTDLELVDLDAPHLHVEGDAGGEGFGAMQMLASSLALCTAAVLQAYAQGVVKAPVARLSVRVRWAYAEAPHRIGKMTTEITWPELPEDRLEAARRAAATCTVHRTFEHPPELETVLRR